MKMPQRYDQEIFDSNFASTRCHYNFQCHVFALFRTVIKHATVNKTDKSISMSALKLRLSNTYTILKQVLKALAKKHLKKQNATKTNAIKRINKIDLAPC